MPIERERKFLIPTRQAQDLIRPEMPRIRIEQHYLSGPQSQDELRVRRTQTLAGIAYCATLKQGHGLERLETEIQLEAAAAQILIGQAEASLRKDRFVLLASAAITLDFYQGGIPDRSDYAVLEIEQQPDAADITAFNAAALGLSQAQEVTDQPGAHNRHFATELNRIERPTISPAEWIGEISQRLDGRTEPLVVTIGGASGSGKTTLIEQLKSCFEQLAVISTDNYYIGKSRMESELPPAISGNFDHPSAVDIERLADQLEQLKAGQTIDQPQYSMQIGEPTGRYTKIAPARLILIEGIVANQPAIARQADLTATTQVDPGIRLARRIQRDKTRTGQTPEQIMAYVMNVAEPAYLSYHYTCDSHADYAIDCN